MPASPVEFTGERFVPECTGEIWAEHWHRYLFARRFVEGRDVLDAASGEGYGSAWLARGARSVVGLDVHAPTVEDARQRYRGPNLRFETGSVAAMPFADASFDCVVSFETLEHLAEQEAMLAEIRRVLRPAGLLLISTPNRVEYTERRDFHNEFHVRELDRNEFRELLGRHFPAQRWYGQKLLFNSAIWPLGGADAVPLRWIALDERPPAMPEPMYFIACAAAGEAHLPQIGDLTLLPDPAEEMYREYEQTVARTQSLEQTVIERDLQLAAQNALAARMEAVIIERDAQVAAHDELTAARERIIAERDRQLEATNARAAQIESLLADRERIVAERDGELAAVNERINVIEHIVAERDAELVAVNMRISEAEKLLQHREALIVERDAQLAALNERQKFAEGLIAERERIIVERDGQIEAATSALEQASERIASLEQEVSRRASLRWWFALPWLRLRALGNPSALGRKAGKA